MFFNNRFSDEGESASIASDCCDLILVRVGVLSRLESDNRLRGVDPSEVPLRFKVRSVTGERPTPGKVVGESAAAK